MHFRLLIISILCFICTAFINVADKIHVSDTEIFECMLAAPDNHSDEISSVDFVNFTSGESTYTTTNSNVRNFTKRQSIQRLPDRYVFHTNTKSYDKSYILSYQTLFYQSQTGLIVPYHTYLSLGVLII